ncbi:MAG: hypothetical protein LBS96_01040 [Oscillospiraceae bacterium]|jgi:hypothetical protein|nr:hypothetical protein [Oscillospiraceae bacterium]
MEDFIKDQILPILKYVPFHWAASYVKKTSNAEVERNRRKAGGFIKGICHPTEDFEQIKGAGIRWNRADIPFPFEKDGFVRQGYLDWKEKMRRYAAGGIKIMAVTPYPRDYIDAGIDPRLPENEARVREIAVFMLTDLKELIGAVQITNEMGIPRFVLPLTMKEACRFIGIQLAAMHPHKGDILLGYNSAGPQADQHYQMRPWLKYCDYIGIDIYIGCFAPVGNSLYMYDLMLRYLWSMTNKPIILCEFGYISGGAPKTPEEKKAILQRYGVNSEAEARANIKEVFEKLNPTMQAAIKSQASGDWGDFLFNIDYRNHFYSELPKGYVLKKHPHTPEGQAGFYREIFPRLAKLPFLLGAFVYCYKDSDRCYVCGQPDCPTETRWGIVTLEDEEKPSYYALRETLATIE